MLLSLLLGETSLQQEKQKYKEGETQMGMKCEGYSQDTPHLPHTPEQLQFSVSMENNK